MIKDLTAWIQANPVLFSTVMWPLITGFVVGLFKPRTPEQYAAMNPRWAGFLIFLSGTGLDPAKLLEGIKKVLTGSSTPASDLKKTPPLPSNAVDVLVPAADDTLAPTTGASDVPKDTDASPTK